MSERGSDRSGAKVRFPPPLATLLTIVAGYLIGRILPLAPEFVLATPLRYWLGSSMIVIAVMVLAVWPIRLFKKTEQNVTPWSATPELIVKGPYHFTRNPMYLMMVLVCLGCAIILSEAWLLILTPGLGIALYHIAIKHEEVYLTEKFGDSYRDYKKKVRRWI